MSGHKNGENVRKAFGTWVFNAELAGVGQILGSHACSGVHWISSKYSFSAFLYCG